MKRLVASSWAASTQSSYNSELKKWWGYCEEKGLSPHEPTFERALDFLVWLHDTQGANYSTIHNARSAMSALTPAQQEVSFGKDPLTSKVVKGMFRETPRIPRKVVVYDTNKVIRYFSQMPYDHELLLEGLTKKLTTLLCILSGQRSQSISKLYPAHMHQDDTVFTFFIPKMLKTTTPTFHQEPLEFHLFPQDEKTCIYRCLVEYLRRTNLIRENLPTEREEKHALILSYHPPHRPVKSATLARYVKETLGEAGIDITVFTTHSTRSASTSKANNMGLSLKDISKAAGWRGDSTFQKHYKFRVTKNFGTVLLNAAHDNS